VQGRESGCLYSHMANQRLSLTAKTARPRCQGSRGQCASYVSRLTHRACDGACKLESCPTQGGTTNHVTQPPFSVLRCAWSSTTTAPAARTVELARFFSPAHPPFLFDDRVARPPASHSRLGGLGSPKPPDTMSVDGKGAAFSDSHLAYTRSMMPAPTQRVRIDSVQPQ
jgi:hypothetical protein